jgi:hypothetical protein
VPDRTYAFVIGTDANTLAELATGLAGAINADGNLPNYVAIAVGDSVVVVDRAATPARPTVRLSIGLAGGGTGSAITVDDRAAASFALGLGGTPIAGEIWFVEINGVQHEYTVRTPLADVVLGLRDALNALPGAYSATLSGSTLTVHSTGTDPFRATVTRANAPLGEAQIFEIDSDVSQDAVVGLAGQPVQGELWTLSITKAGAQPVSVSFTSDPLAQVAAGLAAAITAGSSFAAAAEGSTLVVADPTGSALPASLAVQVRAAGAANVVQATPQTATRRSRARSSPARSGC